MFLPTYEKHKLDKLRKFKRLRAKTGVAYVAVNEDAGVATISEEKHVDFWLYSSFKPSEHIQGLVDIDAYEPHL